MAASLEIRGVRFKSTAPTRWHLASVTYRNSDLPLLSTISLSMPRGPRVVRTASATTWQALMLLMSCGIP